MPDDLDWVIKRNSKYRPNQLTLFASNIGIKQVLSFSNHNILMLDTINLSDLTLDL